ncbi:MAG: hypothetical protein JXR07_05155 [Reichenbachiella sp.]
MKKTINILLAFLLCGSAYTSNAQENDTVSYAENDVRKNYAIYHLAKRYNDPVIARMALYQLMVFSRNESAVLDSLALEYFNQQNYVSAALVAKDNLAINPNSEMSLEIGAISFANIGVKDQALSYYEKLALKNNSTNTYYQVAYLQYDLKRYTEAKTTIKILMDRKESDELKLVFTKLDKTNQEVPMRAALFDLNGRIAEAQGDITAAKNFYLEALKISPGFEMAQANLSKAGK